MTTMTVGEEFQASDDLVSAEGTASVSTGSGDAAGEFCQIPLGRICAGSQQARKNFSTEKLGLLAESIRQQGVLQPIVVRSQHDGTYTLIMGERRFRAAQMVGLHHIPALVRGMTDEQAALAGLIENLQRQDLSPIEEGEAFARLLKLDGYTYRNLGERLGLKGVSKGYIEDRVRVASAPVDVREMVSSRPNTLTHAREITSVADKALRSDAIQRTLEGMPLKGLRLYLKAKRTRAPTTSTPIQPEIAHEGLADDLSVLPELPVSGRPDAQEQESDEAEAAEAAVTLSESENEVPDVETADAPPAVAEDTAETNDLESETTTDPWLELIDVSRTFRTLMDLAELPMDTVQRENLKGELMPTYQALRRVLTTLHTSS